ncbi:MAG: beta-lactamase family protein [Bacteroidales bacterium]|nr:beta-lactamase family protein [Bacteroidales bacterium]
MRAKVQIRSNYFNYLKATKKMKINKLILFIILIIANKSFAQINSKFIDKEIVDSTLARYCNTDEPGMAIGIVQNGKVLYKNAIGVADLSNNISLTDSAVFNIASVSKQFTAFLAIMAEEEGKISLQDDIKKYLPELKHLPYKITIKQLANHTHGLPNYSDIVEMIGFGLASPIRNDQAVQIMLNIRQVNFDAGAQFQYGNTGFMLLAEILKRVYEKPFPILIREKIFEPLFMHQSAVIDNPNTIVKNKAVAYRKSGDGYLEHPNRQMESGSSNIHTSLNDLIKWVINYQKPKVGTEGIYKKMIEHTVLNDGSEVAYGLGLYTGFYKGLNIVFHGGGAAGYRAYILHVPAYDFSIITLGNLESYDGLLIVHDLLDLYFKDHFAEPVPAKTSYTAKELKEFEGTYKFQPGQYWTIKADEENLYFGGDHNPLPLIGDGTFEFFYLPTSYLTFRPNSMEFRIADFTYHCEKVTLNPPILSEKELEKYAGVYQNMEFNTYYETLLIENNLVAKHLTNGEITLQPLSENIFYGEYPLGELDFQINSEGKVNGFVLSGQNFENIKFIKLK